MNFKNITIGLAAVALSVIGCTISERGSSASADDNVYANFPVTLKGYTGSKTTSESYTGQMARQVLHDTLKKLAGKGNGKPSSTLKAKLNSYFFGKAKGRPIIAPKSNGKFVIKQTKVEQISKKKNLSGKTYKGTISGMPNNMSGPALIKFWIDRASSAKKGVDLNNGYNYPQLISKFLMGAVFYNQAVDNYLDEKLSAKKKPNNKPYKKGAHYTGKEHSWDEAFGYFGMPAHGMTLTSKQLYAIAKRKPEALAYADHNGDGKVDLYKEMVFAPAYYAASFDKKGKTTYAKTITQAFLDGRRVITSAKGAKLTDTQRASLRKYAAIIEKNWEQTLAEAVFKYAGSCFKDLKELKKDQSAKSLAKYVKHWGELKGFSLSLQTGRKNLGETATRLNRLIGFGPVLMNSSQVVDINSKGQYVKDQSSGLDNYMVHMLKVQKLMVDKFGVKALDNDALSGLGSMIKKLGKGAAAEND
ncbi:MAG: DUF4856 domain-containing protein [Rhodospirillaceae bacterium]|nr:DUF4856 domain-containing protein [Rhodospirillaceae bacterium]